MGLIRELVDHFGLSAHDFMRLSDSAPARYKVYNIPKRKGGSRTITQPSRELKAVQRFVVWRKLCAFPVHGAAMGYVKGRNIRENAVAHRDRGLILKLDFAEFFPSIGVADWEDLRVFTPWRRLNSRKYGYTQEFVSGVSEETDPSSMFIYWSTQLFFTVKHSSI